MEFVFALFYLSGLIKSFLLFLNIDLPIDFTIITASLLLISLIFCYTTKPFRLAFDRRILLTFIFLLFFYIWMIVTLIYTLSDNYSVTKTLYFIPNILAFIFPILYKPFDIRRFFKFIIIIVPILTVFFLSFYLSYRLTLVESDYYNSIKGLYLTCATLLGINILVLINSHRRLFPSTIIHLGLLTISIILLILSGARGPLMFLILLIIWIASFKILRIFVDGKIKANLKNFVFAGTGLFLIGILSFLFFSEEILFLAERTITRTSLFLSTNTSTGMGSSVNVRIDQILLSLQLISDNFYDSIFGYGIGSFGILERGVDVRSYPHNIFLEIWVEMGIVGLILFSCFLFMVFTKHKGKLTYISLFVLIFIILNCMKSNSIVDMRVYFCIFGMFVLGANKDESISNYHSTSK